MNSIISLSPDYAVMSAAEIAELEAWFDEVDARNDTDFGWDRLAAAVDSGAI